MLVWFEFIVCLLLIAVAGYRLSLYGDIIGEKLELSRSWIGVVMVASVTSLPELVTGISSVTVAQTPDIAAGDVLGSCVFNLLLIVILDFLHRQESVYTRANMGHVLSAGFGVILIGCYRTVAYICPSRMWGCIRRSFCSFIPWPCARYSVMSRCRNCR